MASAAYAFENMTLNITQEIHVRASLETTFAAMLEQLGPQNDAPEYGPMPMKVEAWPGGRWYRDLGDGNGHLWAHVQAIKKPTLLEFVGPLFLSYPVVSNVQYRLSMEDGGTLIRFHHKAWGHVEDEYRKGLEKGWTHTHARLRERAEKQGRK